MPAKASSGLGLVLGEAAPALLGAAHHAVQPGREPGLDAGRADQALVDGGREQVRRRARRAVAVHEHHDADPAASRPLLMELERHRTYLELDTPGTGGHEVGHDLVHGDPVVVDRVARALGLRMATDAELVVPRT